MQHRCPSSKSVITVNKEGPWLLFRECAKYDGNKNTKIVRNNTYGPCLRRLQFEYNTIAGIFSKSEMSNGASV